MTVGVLFGQVKEPPPVADEMLAACKEMTFSRPGGGAITLYGSAVAGVEGEGFARSLTTGPGYGLGGFTLTGATTKVGDHIVSITGFGPLVYTDEFVRLANAANERVRTEL